MIIGELLAGANTETVVRFSKRPSLQTFYLHVCSELDLGTGENSIQVRLFPGSMSAPSMNFLGRSSKRRFGVWSVSFANSC